MDGSARLTGPVEGQPGIIMAGFDLGQVGYTLEEFFLESAATCFEPAGPAGADGYWQVTPSGQCCSPPGWWCARRLTQARSPAR